MATETSTTSPKCQVIEVQQVDKDRYGRVVANVHVGGVYVNREQVAKGLAWRYGQYDKKGEFTQVQQAAKTACKGLWGDAHPGPPWEWRKSEKERKGAKDGAGELGAIDTFVDTLNPFSPWVDIPNIGPVFGNEDAYFVGNVAGTVAGMAAGMSIGNIAAGTSSLVACGSLAQKAAKLYTAIDTVAGIANATSNIAAGNASLGDALAFLPVMTVGVQKLRGVPTNCCELKKSSGCPRPLFLLAVSPGIALTPPSPARLPVAARSAAKE
jgi:hypothetical protein